jgi:hypothetical protein
VQHLRSGGERSVGLLDAAGFWRIDES